MRRRRIHRRRLHRLRPLRLMADICKSHFKEPVPDVPPPDKVTLSSDAEYRLQKLQWVSPWLNDPDGSC